MRKNSEDKIMVSEFYKSLEPNNDSVAPPESVDEIILKASLIKVKRNKKINKYFIPLSIAASLVAIGTIVLQMTVINNQTSQYNDLTLRKQPMYMLQRSKPVSADEMIKSINDLVGKGKTEQAKVLFKRFNLRYPNHDINTDLRNSLQ